MSTLTITTSVREGSTTLASTSVAKTIQSKVEVNETIADAASDYELPVAIDTATLKYLLIEADQVLTIETNDGSSPDDTITLQAGIPIQWYEGATALLSADVTALFVSNSSGSDATLTVIAGHDAA